MAGVRIRSRRERQSGYLAAARGGRHSRPSNQPFVGRPDSSRNMAESIDWWLAPIGSGELKKTGACGIFIRNGIVADYQCAIPGYWEGTHIYFSAPSAEGSNLWRADLSVGRPEIT